MLDIVNGDQVFVRGGIGVVFFSWLLDDLLGSDLGDYVRALWAYLGS